MKRILMTVLAASLLTSGIAKADRVNDEMFPKVANVATEAKTKAATEQSGYVPLPKPRPAEAPPRTR